MSRVVLTGLMRHPLKSGRSQRLDEARLGPRGLAGDREWMLVRPDGRFLTQRELPRMALLAAQPEGAALALAAPGLGPLRAEAGATCEVQVWKDRVLAQDAGDAVAAELSAWLGAACRLVRFDPARPRLSAPEWTGGLPAENAFSDGFPLLLVNQASLDDLGRRTGREWQAERFRPNLVVEGLPPWDEDRLLALRRGDIELRIAKPCARCRITTVDPATGAFDGEEPLRTLRAFRHDARVGGFTFGQNVLVASGVGSRLAVGDAFEAELRPG